MAKLENSLKNMFLSLTIITIVVGALLGYVASVTADPIAQAAAAAQTDAIKAVAPEFDAVAEPVVYEFTDGNLPAEVYAVTKGGQPVGYAVKSITKKGFGGKVTVMFGFDMEGNITGYNVLDCSNETPGLGAKMPDWFQQGQKGDVIGKNPGSNNMTVTKDGGEVDAITAATISSRAFCDALALAYAAISGNADGVSSATAQAPAEGCCQGDSCQCCSPDSCQCCPKDSCEACPKEGCPKAQ